MVSGDGSVDLIIEDQTPKQPDTQSTDLHTTANTAPKLNRETITKQPNQESWETERMITTSTATPLSLTTSTTTTTGTPTTQTVTTNRSTTVSGPPEAQKPHHNATLAAKKHTVKSRLTWNEESAATTDSPKNPGKFMSWCIFGHVLILNHNIKNGL